MTPEEADIIYRLVETKRKIQKARYTLPDTDFVLDKVHLVIDMLRLAEERIDEILKNNGNPNFEGFSSYSKEN